MVLSVQSDKITEIDNQQKKYEELITIKYNSDELKALHKKITISRYSEEFLKRNYLEQLYQFECVRCFEGVHEIFDEEYTYNYVVLQDTLGGVLFAFFNENNEVFGSYYFDHLLTKDDFSNIAENRTVTDKQIMELDTNTYVLGTSGIYSTAHIVKEGLFILEYAQRGNATVKSKKFYEEKADLEMFYYFIPGILDIDKEEMIRQFNELSD